MAKYERLTAEGVWVEMTREEARERRLAESIALYGEEEGRKHAEARWRDLHTPPKPWSEMTEGERRLADRMQAEEEVVNQAMARSGYTSFDDLPGPDYDEEALLDPLAPSDDDDEEFPIKVRRGPRSDYQDALEDLAGRRKPES